MSCTHKELNVQYLSQERLCMARVARQKRGQVSKTKCDNGKAKRNEMRVGFWSISLARKKNRSARCHTNASVPRPWIPLDCTARDSAQCD